LHISPLVRNVRKRFLKALLPVIGSLLMGAVAVIAAGFVFGVPASGLFRHAFDLVFVEPAYGLYRLGAPEFIASTGGHIAHLTLLGIVLLCLVPAGTCFSWGIRLRRQRKSQHE
jgi:hypothetical protein